MAWCTASKTTKALNANKKKWADHKSRADFLALVQLNRQKDVGNQIIPYKIVAYVNHRASWKGALTH